MGLLDIWNDWKNQSGYSSIEDMARDSQYGQPLKKESTQSSDPLRQITKQDGTISPVRTISRNTGIGPNIKQKAMMSPGDTQKLATPPVNKMYQDPITTGGMGTQEGDISFFQRLSNMANVDFDKAAATWKDKGGFEGLMANPAFTIGLAFMQAGAQGKTLGQGALNEVIKGAGISQQYKSILASRKQAPIQATATDVAEVKSLLSTMNVEDPSTLEKFFGKVTGKGNLQQKFDIAAEDIAVELQKEMALLQKNNKSGKPLVFDTRRKLKIIERLLKSGKFKKKGGTFFTAATLESDVGGKLPEGKMHGGPVQAGKPYVVGEEGPEIVIPKSDGNVLTTDDSQIYAMLLAANPQLQKVSKQRAEKILRARFPEYFE